MRCPHGLGLGLLLCAAPAAAQRGETSAPSTDSIVVSAGGGSASRWSAAAYEPLGFNLRPVVAPSVRLVTGAGAVTFSTQARYGQSLVDTERYGSLRLDAIAELAPGWGTGVEATVMFDLEIDDDEPLGEPASELRSGPLLVFVRGPLRAVACGGIQRSEPRFGEPKLGAIAFFGLGVGL
jgi:hypothetical protein